MNDATHMRAGRRMHMQGSRSIATDGDLLQAAAKDSAFARFEPFNYVDLPGSKVALKQSRHSLSGIAGEEKAMLIAGVASHETDIIARFHDLTEPSMGHSAEIGKPFARPVFSAAKRDLTKSSICLSLNCEQAVALERRLQPWSFERLRLT
jgi:hypothetical protein